MKFFVDRRFWLDAQRRCDLLGSDEFAPRTRTDRADSAAGIGGVKSGGWLFGPHGAQRNAGLTRCKKMPELRCAPFGLRSLGALQDRMLNPPLPTHRHLHR